MFKYELPDNGKADKLVTELTTRNVHHTRMGNAVFADFNFDQTLMMDFINWEVFLVPMGDWDTLNVVA